MPGVTITASSPLNPSAKPGLIARLFGARARDGEALYTRIVELARARDWYADLGVPDSVDGRFDVLTLVLSVVLLELETRGQPHAEVRLTERFVDDMDGQIREIGFGDLVVGKQVGGIMAVLGGRLGAYRTGIDAETLGRTLWRGQAPGAAVVAATLERIAALRAEVAATPLDALLAGRIA